MANRVTIKETIINVSDTVQVHQKIKEGDKERIQVFEGIVIAIKGRGTGKSFTVRRIASAAIGVERIWPIICPSIAKVVVKKKGKVRRAKLYYLRERVGRQAVRVKSIKPIKTIKSVPARRKPARDPRHNAGIKTKKDAKDEEKKPRKSRRKPRPKVSKK